MYIKYQILNLWYNDDDDDDDDKIAVLKIYYYNWFVYKQRE